MVIAVSPLFATGAMATAISSDLPITVGLLATMNAVFFGVSAVLSPIGGMLVPKWGVPNALTAQTLCGGISLAVIAGASHSGALIAAMLPAAAGNALIQPAVNTALSSIPTHRRGLALGTVQAAIPLAGIAAGFALAIAGDRVPWRFVGLAYAGAALVVCVLCRTLPAPAAATKVRVSESAGPGDRPTTAAPFRSLLAVAAVCGGAGACIPSFSAITGTTSDVASSSITIAITVAGTACAAVRIWSGKRAAGRLDAGLRMMAWLLLLGVIGYGTIAIPHWWAFAPALVVAYCGAWGPSTLINLSVTLMRPHDVAVASGRSQAAFYAGCTTGPVVFALVNARFGLLQAWWTIGLTLLMAAAAAALMIRTTEPSPG
ncbi:MFS transporter [Williamsia sp.]|uniref:MFS transporter n=1 Tax=Williamsia sp. TaxID=1872085 RepID=UPI002F92D5D9